MRIHILGSGAIGTFLGIRFAKARPGAVTALLKPKNVTASHNDSVTFTLRDKIGSHLDSADIRIEKAPPITPSLLAQPLQFRTHNPAQSLRSANTSIILDEDPRGDDPSSTSPDSPQIDVLVVATKAQDALPSIKSLAHRLTGSSTIILSCNGGGLADDIHALYTNSNKFTRKPNLIQMIMSHGVSKATPIPHQPNSYELNPPFNVNLQSTQGSASFSVSLSPIALASTEKFLMLEKDSGYGPHGVPHHLRRHPETFDESTPQALFSMRPFGRDAPSQNPLLNIASQLQPKLDHVPRIGETGSLLYAINALLDANINASWLSSPDFSVAQLEKLTVNIAINSITALLGVTNGSSIPYASYDHIIDQISAEASTVFASALLSKNDDLSEFPPMHPLSPTSLAKTIRSVSVSTSANTSSTLADILQLTTASLLHPPSPSLELDYIHGYVMRLGHLHSVPTPVTSMLYHLVRLRADHAASGIPDLVQLSAASKHALAFKTPAAWFSNIKL